LSEVSNPAAPADTPSDLCVSSRETSFLSRAP
jgi:hypothetical protein